MFFLACLLSVWSWNLHWVSFSMVCEVLRKWSMVAQVWGFCIKRWNLFSLINVCFCLYSFQDLWVLWYMNFFGFCIWKLKSFLASFVENHNEVDWRDDILCPIFKCPCAVSVEVLLGILCMIFISFLPFNGIKPSCPYRWF